MPELSGASVLVTGGAGFIGSHLVDALLRDGAALVTVVDTFFLGSDRNLEDAEATGERLRVHREDAADLTAMAAIIETTRPSIVFNLATKALRYSFLNPPGACRVNVDIALTLCELLRSGAYERLVHVSSSEVYGTAVYTPMDESHPLLAETTYAAGKAGADLCVASYVRMFDVDAVIARPFNNYGPRQNDGDFAAVIPITVRRIQAGLPPIIEGDGAQTRDFAFVLDTVDALMRLATTHVEHGCLLNLGSGAETQIGTIIRTIAEIMEWNGPIEHAPARPADVRRHWSDSGKAEKVLGALLRTPLADGLRATVASYGVA